MSGRAREIVLYGRPGGGDGPPAPALLAGQWRADSYAAAFSDGDPITSDWIDLSVNGRDMPRGFGTDPTYKDVGGPNGQPFVEFPGSATPAGYTADRADPAPWPATLDGTDFFSDAPATIAIVCRPDDFSTERPIITRNRNLQTTPGHWNVNTMVGGDAGKVRLTRVNDWGTAAISTTALTAAAWNSIIITVEDTGGATDDVNFYINGGAAEAKTISPTGGLSDGSQSYPFRFAAFRWGTFSGDFDGGIAEILYYESELTGANLANLQAYLSSRYGL